MIETRGFCRNREQEADILAHGVPAKAVFMADRGAEGLESCIATFRGRPGVLIISHDLRVFGATKRQVAEVMSQLESLGIKVHDLTHPEDTTTAKMLHRANVAISGARLGGDRKRARKQGRTGGKAKGKWAWDRRDELAPRWLLDRIVDHRAIPWEVKLQVLQPHFTEATLRRRYGIHATDRS
jgi:hypothetical protein